MAYDIRSISQVGTSEPFELQVARGQIPGHSHQHIIADVPEMSNNTLGTVWDVNDTPYPWSAWDTPGTLAVARANAADADKKVILTGLDVNYEPIAESVTLTDATGNMTTQVFQRLQSARMNGTGENAGDITITRAGTTVGFLNAGVGQTLMGIFTIPAAHTAYLTQGTMSQQRDGDASGFFYYRIPDDQFLVGHTFEVADGQYLYQFTCPFALPAKADLDVRARTRANNARITAAFDMILIKDGGPL
jgi:hypothetical protein